MGAGVALNNNRFDKGIAGTTTRQTLCQVCLRTEKDATGEAAGQGLEALQPSLLLAAECRHKPSIKVLETLQWAISAGLFPS